MPSPLADFDKTERAGRERRALPASRQALVRLVQKKILGQVCVALISNMQLAIQSSLDACVLMPCKYLVHILSLITTYEPTPI